MKEDIAYWTPWSRPLPGVMEYCLVKVNLVLLVVTAGITRLQRNPDTLWYDEVSQNTAQSSSGT